MKKLVPAVFAILALVPHAVLAQDSPAGRASVAVFSFHEPIPPSVPDPKWMTKDPNTNGAVIGGIIGAAAGVVVGLGLASIDESSDSLAGPALGMAVLGGLAGAGVGWVVDNRHQQAGYKIRVTRNITIEPSVGVKNRPGQATASVRGGVAASVGW